MKKTVKRVTIAVLVAGMAALVPMTGAHAQLTGSKPVKIIVPFSAGALIDNIARAYSDKLAARLGQPIVVENRPGAGGMVGTQRLLAEDPAQNTMLFVSSSYAVNPSVQANMPFDTLKDLSGISLIAYAPTVMVVNPASGFESIKDFIEKGKSARQPFNYGSAGINSATDMVGRYFSKETGVPLDHVPYKAVHEGMLEVLAGRVDTSFPSISQALPFMQNNRLKALAITSKERSSLAPNVPTMDETVAPGFDYAIWYGVIMNAKTGDEVKRTVAAHIAEINRDPEMIKWLENQGLVPQSKTLKAFDDYIASEIAKFGKILSKSN